MLYRNLERLYNASAKTNQNINERMIAVNKLNMDIEKVITVGATSTDLFYLRKSI